MRLVNPYPHPLVYPTIACPAPTKKMIALPSHLVWPVTLSQAEAAAEVCGEHWLLLDGRQQSLVDGLLVCGTAGRWLLLLLNY